MPGSGKADVADTPASSALGLTSEEAAWGEPFSSFPKMKAADVLLRLGPRRRSPRGLVPPRLLDGGHVIALLPFGWNAAAAAWASGVPGSRRERCFEWPQSPTLSGPAALCGCSSPAPSAFVDQPVARAVVPTRLELGKPALAAPSLPAAPTRPEVDATASTGRCDHSRSWPSAKASMAPARLSAADSDEAARQPAQRPPSSAEIPRSACVDVPAGAR